MKCKTKFSNEKKKDFDTSSISISFAENNE